MTVRTAWQAVTLRPLRFLASPWPWRALAYLLSGVALGAATVSVLLALATAGVLLVVVVVGLIAFLGIALSGVVVARFERWRLRLVDADPAPDPHRRPDRPGIGTWVLTRLSEQVTWREFGYTALSVLALHRHHGLRPLGEEPDDHADPAQREAEQEQQPERGQRVSRAAVPAPAQRQAQMMDATRFPTASRVGTAAAQQHQAPTDPAHAFAFGLARIVDGVQHLIDGKARG